MIRTIDIAFLPVFLGFQARLRDMYALFARFDLYGHRPYDIVLSVGD